MISRRCFLLLLMGVANIPFGFGSTLNFAVPPVLTPEACILAYDFKCIKGVAENGHVSNRHWNLLQPELTADCVLIYQPPNTKRCHHYIVWHPKTNFAKRTKAAIFTSTVGGFGYALKHLPGAIAVWDYAATMGYDLYYFFQTPDELFGRKAPYARILATQTIFSWGYEYDMYLDWDVLMRGRQDYMDFTEMFRASPSEPPRDLLLQADRDVCAGVQGHRNSEWMRQFLRLYWALPMTGCCNGITNKFTDNMALRHLVGLYLNEVAPGIYNMNDIKDLSISINPRGTTDYHRVKNHTSIMFREGAASGTHFERMNLHNCDDLWPRQLCASSAQPALFHHTAGFLFPKAYNANYTKVTYDYLNDLAAKQEPLESWQARITQELRRVGMPVGLEVKMQPITKVLGKIKAAPPATGR